MKNKIKYGRAGLFIKAWKDDYIYKTLISAGFSFVCTVLFTLYHGYLGIRYRSAWHCGICVFFLLLMAVRGSILLTEKQNRTRLEAERLRFRYRTFLISAALMLALDLSLLLPIILMVTLATPVNMGVVPAIAMAAYTTYKIIMASIHFRRQRSRACGNLLVMELRTVNFIDALVSILTLQNTLIMVNRKSEGADMVLVSAFSSAVIYVAIVAVTVRMLLKGQNGAAPRPGRRRL